MFFFARRTMSERPQGLFPRRVYFLATALTRGVAEGCVIKLFTMAVQCAQGAGGAVPHTPTQGSQVLAPVARRLSTGGSQRSSLCQVGRPARCAGEAAAAAVLPAQTGRELAGAPRQVAGEEEPVEAPGEEGPGEGPAAAGDTSRTAVARTTHDRSSSTHPARWDACRVQTHRWAWLMPGRRAP